MNQWRRRDQRKWKKKLQQPQKSLFDRDKIGPKWGDPRWSIPQVLSRSARPGYPRKSGIQENEIEVQDFIKRLRSKGIRTILVLLEQKELDTYYDFNLLQTYADHGFEPIHFPIVDHRKSTFLNFDEIMDITKIFKTAKLPMHIHCSAGMDRTGEVTKALQYYIDLQKKKTRGDSAVDRIK